MNYTLTKGSSVFQMKKIICLILALVFTLGIGVALAACNRDEPCTHSDTDYDGKCDKCGNDFGHACLDADKSHACDTCGRTMGEHIDADKNHACDYGCSVAIGVCDDSDKDHVCDYGCDKAYGVCEDADKDHVCDYGCGEEFGEHADGDDADHLCDHGCGRIADDGCYDTVVDGKCDECGADIEHTCLDENKDHACDICSQDVNADKHIDENKDHVCDYGCSRTIGVCKDADRDHYCDHGCGKYYGEHADGSDTDHLCDYGCGFIADDGCRDINDNSKCDECGGDYRDGFEPIDPALLIDRACATVEESSPTKIVTQFERVGDLGVSGTFIIEKQGEDLIFTYSYQTPADPMVSDEAMVTVEGKVYYKDGRFSEDGKTWTAGTPAVWSVYLDLERRYLIDPKINPDGTVLSAEISAEDAKAAFGTDLNADGNLSIQIRIDRQRVNYFDITCTTDSGATVNVRTSYTYQSIELDFPSAE